MFDFIRGQLVTTKVHEVIVEAHGIGYRLSVPTTLLGQLPALGGSVQLFTSLVVKETSQQLYGFLSADERDLFELLIALSGVGPKTGLALISYMSLEQLHYAMQKDDASMLARVPGIGKKTAERLLIDLRDKLPSLARSLPMPTSKGSNAGNDKIQDAMSALINLGYNQQSAHQALKKAIATLPDDVDLPLLVTSALREI